VKSRKQTKSGQRAKAKSKSDAKPRGGAKSAKKAVAKKTVAKKTVAKKATTKKATTKKATAKKAARTTAKKAAGKAAQKTTGNAARKAPKTTAKRAAKKATRTTATRAAKPAPKKAASPAAPAAAPANAKPKAAAIARPVRSASIRRGPYPDVAIVGAYNTVQAKRIPDMTESELVLDAIHGALADAGLTPAAVDGVNVSTWVSQLNPRSVVQWFGGRPSWTGTSHPGIESVLEAAAAIQTGQCETVVIATAQCGEYTDRAATVSWTRPENEFVECWGLYTAAEFALMAQRHMHLYGTKREALSEVASAIRSNGAVHPEAVMYGRTCTPADVEASRMVADPYRLLDCCITSEGGAAMVLTTRERAKDLDATPISILGGALDRQGMSYVTAPIWDKVGWVGRRGAKLTFEQCGLGPKDVDFAELYDPFSFEIIRQLEAFGFCGEGEGGDFVMNGRIRIGGELPVATNGGTMSFSHAGVVQLLQKPLNAVLQLRGELPKALTVPNPKVALATNGGSGALFCDVMALGKEPV
jgi:acetyl-CoA acetyltransferase